jgi:hypothetical protein
MRIEVAHNAKCRRNEASEREIQRLAANPFDVERENATRFLAEGP